MVSDLKFKVTESTYELFPAEVYNAKLTKIEPKQVEFNGSMNDVLEWTFTFLDGEYVGKTINDIASYPANGLSPKSKLRLWVEGLLGRSLQGYTGDVDITKLVGKDCRITVSRGPNTKGREVNKVTSILPPKKADAPKIETPPPPPATNEDPLF